MVWGCFSAAGVGPLHLIEGTMNAKIHVRILERYLKRAKREIRLPRSFIFQQDNDPKHTARKTRDWFTKRNRHVLKWPANSPDLNPRENLWVLLNRKRKLFKLSRGAPLFDVLKTAWQMEHLDELLNNLLVRS